MAILIAVAFYAAYAGINSRESQEIQRINAKQASDNRSNSHEDSNTQGAYTSKTISAVNESKTKGGQGERETSANHIDEEGTEFWPARFGIRIKITDSIIAIFTICLFFATILLWRATLKLAREGRTVFEATERAFVFIDGFNFELTTAADAKVISIEMLPERYRSQPELYISRFAAQPRWKNSGSTPTIKMTINTGWRGPVGPIPPEYVYRTPAEPFFIAPNAVEPSGYVEITPARSLVDYGLNPIGDEPQIYFWGRSEYDDIFGKHHFVEWCYCLRLDRHDGKTLRASFIQWGDYNRTDEPA
jgi:hypothetical protein